MNGGKTLDEWIALYEKKTGRVFQREEKLRLFYYPEKGFCEVGVDTNNKIVMAYQLCGDGWFWRRMLEFIAESLGFPCCGTICIRHIKPYIRFWGFTIDKTETTDDGLPRYHCIEKGTGKKRRKSASFL